MKEETIFYALFRSQTKIHDRMRYEDSHKTLKDFMNWIQEERAKIETQYGSVCIEKFDIKYSK